jgi:hypothetical protein
MRYWFESSLPSQIDKMLFRLNFDEKLDLSKFRQHAIHYIGRMREITYHLSLKNHKILLEIASSNDLDHIITVTFFDLKRDVDGEIIQERVIIPMVDTRFKESNIIKELFPVDNYRGTFESSKVKITVDKICELTKLIHKINYLKVFL